MNDQPATTPPPTSYTPSPTTPDGSPASIGGSMITATRTQPSPTPDERTDTAPPVPASHLQAGRRRYKKRVSASIVLATPVPKVEEHTVRH